MPKRAILYARVSADDRGKDGRNLTGQLDMCREYALAHEWSIEAELSEDDKGASGAAFELPGLNRALDMAQAGKYDVLVVREMDRLSRNLAKQLIVEEELKRSGVEIEYALAEYPDTPEGRLNKHIRATIAEYEREKIVERLVRGQRSKVKAGSVLVYGCPPYGYRVIDEDNKWQLVVHEPEARIVRLVFAWYVHGDEASGPMSLRSIAQKLTGIPTYADTHGRRRKRARGQWSASVVGRMLRNETYAGLWYYGKRHPGGNGRWAQNDVGHLLSVEVPSIIDRSAWEAAQARLSQNRGTGRYSSKHDYLLSRRLTCGFCGLKMAGSGHVCKGATYLYYRCPATKSSPEYAERCDAPYFRADAVDRAVWEWVRELLENPAALDRGLKKHQQEREEASAPMQERLSVVEDLLTGNGAQLEKLLDLYLAGEFPKDVLTERRVRLEATIEALQRERSSLAAHLMSASLTEDQAAELRGFLDEVAEGLEVAASNFGTRRRVIEALNVSATLTVQGGDRTVNVQCILSPSVCALHPIPQPRRFV